MGGRLLTPGRGEDSIGARVLIFCVAGVALAAALILVTKARAAASPVQIVSATVNADRSVSVGWNIPAGYWGGALIINTSAVTDSTGEMPFVDNGATIDYQLLDSRRTNYKTLPLKLSIQQPATVYLQVQLIDPYDDTLGCQQGAYLADCDSQVVALTVTPICTDVLVKAGYYTRKQIRRGHWLERNGHFVRRHGHRVWVKAVYRRIYHRPVYQTQCH